MENKIYSISISFLLEVEAESAIEAQNSALDKLRWKMYDNEARYLKLHVVATKKVIPPATLAQTPAREPIKHPAYSEPEEVKKPEGDIPF